MGRGLATRPVAFDVAFDVAVSMLAASRYVVGPASCLAKAEAWLAAEASWACRTRTAWRLAVSVCVD